mgnify:FL=1
MAVYVNNFTIETGAYFSRDFYLDNSDGTSLNLTGYSAKSHLRKHPESVNATSIFNVGFINREDGHIRVSLATTATKEIKPGRYVYDVLFTDPSDKKSIVIEGQVLATQDISPTVVITSYAFESFAALPTDSHVGLDGSTGYTNLSPDGDWTTGINQITSYGIIAMGHWHNACLDMPTLTTNLQNATYINALKSYMEMGGIVFYIGEYVNCGNTDHHNDRLALLGTEIRLNSISLGAGVGNLQITNNVLPAQWNFDATNTLTGGTALYTFTGQTDPSMSFEKIGNGAIVVVGDSNGSTKTPANWYEGMRSLIFE